jgi:CBS domain-containing protein
LPAWHHDGGDVGLPDGTVVRLRHADLRATRDEGEEITARDANDHVVGRVAYRRIYGPRATVTIDVDDGYWHRGLPAVLLARLGETAALFGITTFIVRAPAADSRLLALLRETVGAHRSGDGPFVDMEFATAAASSSGEQPGARPSPIAGGGLSLTATPAPAFDDARVADVMRGPVLTCGPETPIPRVARMMADEHVHAVVVTGIIGTAWSVVTSLDVAAAAAAGAVDEVAREAATAEPVTVAADAPLSAAARIMLDNGISHVLVVGGDGRPAGIVSTADVARSFAAAADPAS